MKQSASRIPCRRPTRARVPPRVGVVCLVLAESEISATLKRPGGRAGGGLGALDQQLPPRSTTFLCTEHFPGALRTTVFFPGPGQSSGVRRLRWEPIESYGLPFSNGLTGCCWVARFSKWVIVINDGPRALLLSLGAGKHPHISGGSFTPAMAATGTPLQWGILSGKNFVI